MIVRLFSLMTALSAALSLAADDPWAKLREIKSGSEIRVYRKGSKTPVTGKLDQATEDAVVIMLAKEEIGIQREDVDRIDSRDAPKGSRVSPGASTPTQKNPAKLPPLGPRRNDDRPDEPSSSGSIQINSRPDFQTVYTRPAHK